MVLGLKGLEAFSKRYARKDHDQVGLFPLFGREITGFRSFLAVFL